MLSKLEDVTPASPLTAPPTSGLMSSIRARKSRAARVIVDEVFAGLWLWPVWLVMGWDDIRQRYRRSILGPFWITLSMGVFILVLSIIYSRLFHTPLERYMPFLTVGYIVWGFISTSTNEACNAFHEGSRIIKQIKLPYSVYVMRVICRNFIVFLHTIVIYIPVAIYFSVVPTPMSLLVLPGLLLMILNQIWVTTVIGIFSTRYRDILPIVATMIQLMMFATPIMWMTGTATNLQFAADINPAYHLIEIIRAPLLGTAPQPLSWMVAIGMVIVGWVLAAALFVRTARRIVYWL